MKTYNVLWTEDAIGDFNAIITYIYSESPTNAKSVYSAIKEQCTTLEQFSFRARTVPELESLGMMQYRELLFKRWRIIYTVKSYTVYLLLIIDSRQDIQDQLIARILKEQ